MNRHVAALGIAFRATGLIVGIPAFGFAAYCGYLAYELFEAPPGDSPDAYDPGGGLISLLTAGASDVDSGLHLLAGSAAWLFTCCAIFGLFTAIVSFFVFQIGGGIGRRAGWGRVLGFLFSLLLLLACAGLVTVLFTLPHLKPDGAYVAIPVGMAALYSLWVLTFRFSPR